VSLPQGRNANDVHNLFVVAAMLTVYMAYTAFLLSNVLVWSIGLFLEVGVQSILRDLAILNFIAVCTAGCLSQGLLRLTSSIAIIIVHFSISGARHG
jgi:hypothetical protein